MGMSSRHALLAPADRWLILETLAKPPPATRLAVSITYEKLSDGKLS